MTKNLNLFAFALTDEEMKKTAALDEGENLFFSYYAPQTVKRIVSSA